MFGMGNFFEKPGKEDTKDDDKRLPGELPEAVVGNNTEGWKTAQESEAEAGLDVKRTQDNEDVLEEAWSIETMKESDQADVREEDFIPPKELEGETLYDKQIEEAQRVEKEPLHPYIEIEEKFDQKRDEEERIGFDEEKIPGKSRGLFMSDSHGRHGRKPEQPKGGESVRNMDELV